MGMFFNTYVLRSPLYPIEFLKKLIDNKKIIDGYLLKLMDEPILLESIFIASPVLFRELKKWKNGIKVNEKELQKIKLSFLKYLLRISYRCTPFGIFSGCSVGEFGKESNVVLQDKAYFNKNIKLDMGFVQQLVESLKEDDNIISKVKYYTNNSYYLLGDSIRYTKKTESFGDWKYSISSVQLTEYLFDILRISKEGITINELVRFLSKKYHVQENEAKEFINEIIDEEILVSELEQMITGYDSAEFLMNFFDKKNIVNHPYEQIFNKIDKLSRTKLGANLSEYQKLFQTVKDTGFELPKNLLQVDLVKTHNGYIDNSIQEEIARAIQILFTFNFDNISTSKYLSSLKDSFTSRYGDEEIPLLQVLDLECGINTESYFPNDIAPLVDDLKLVNLNYNTNIELNYFQREFLKKYGKKLENNDFEIELEEDFILKFAKNKNRIPDTYSTKVTLLKNNDQNLIILESVGGSTAANLIGRFSLSNKEIQDLANSVSSFEQSQNENEIIAEVVHIPQPRSGNILKRTNIRDYEIPYYTRSSVNVENQIELQDLLMSVRNNSIVLRSKRLNKSIKPKLTTAHNFSNSSLPIYKFLCNVQFDNVLSGASFPWGQLHEIYSFLPRIKYKNTILSRATWLVHSKELIDLVAHSRINISKFRKWRKKRKIPQWILFAEGDNELILNLENETCIDLLLSLTKNKSSFHLKEDLIIDNDSIVSDSFGKMYNNEFVFLMKKQETKINHKL